MKSAVNALSAHKFFPTLASAVQIPATASAAIIDDQFALSAGAQAD